MESEKGADRFLQAVLKVPEETHVAKKKKKYLKYLKNGKLLV